MSPADVAELVLLMTAAYPDYRLHDATASVYEKFLGDLDLVSAKQAVVHHVATRKWFPKVSEIREAVLDIEVGYGITPVEKVLGQLRAREPIALLAPMAQEALKLTGGLWEMNRTTNPSAWRAQFRKAYEGLREECLVEKRQAATQGLLAQFQPKQQLEDDNARSTRLAGGNSSPGYFCHGCHRSHSTNERCPAR